MNTTTRDRAIGAVLGSAAGDALGAGYEFRPAVPEPTRSGWPAAAPSAGLRGVD